MFRGLQRKFGRGRGSEKGFVGRYSTFDEASKAFPGEGYNDKEIAQSIVGHSTVAGPHLLFDMDNRFIQAAAVLGRILAAKQSTSLRVVDLGGGAGNYHRFMVSFFPEIEFDWTVVETEALVGETRSVSHERLRWTTEVPDDPFDVALCSGALMYLPNPWDLMSKLRGKAQYMLLNRVFTQMPDEGQHHARVQIPHKKVHSGRLPIWIFSEAQLLAELSEVGTLVASWTVTDDIGPNGNYGTSSRGFLLQPTVSAQDLR